MGLGYAIGGFVGDGECVGSGEGDGVGEAWKELFENSVLRSSSGDELDVRVRLLFNDKSSGCSPLGELTYEK